MNRWDEKRTAKLRELAAKGWSYTEIAAYLATTKGAIAGKLAKLGIKGKPQRTAAQALDEFAEALSHHGDIARAGAEIGVGVGQAKNLFTELRRALGRQAR